VSQPERGHVADRRAAEPLEEARRRTAVTIVAVAVSVVIGVIIVIRQ
jgi:predicted Zn-dependent protease